MLAGTVAATLPKESCTILSLDWFYRDRSHQPVAERATANFDEPDALEWPLIRSQIESLARRESIRVPEYDFATHARTRRTRLLAPKSVVVIEGLLALYDPEVRGLCDLLVFVEAPSVVMLERRIARDVRERGRTRECVARQYTSQVLPMAKTYVLPTRAYAGIIVDGTEPVEKSARRVAERILAAGPAL